MVGVMSGGTIETGLEMERLFPGELKHPFRLGGASHLARGDRDPDDADPTEPRYDATIRRCAVASLPRLCWPPTV